MSGAFMINLHLHMTEEKNALFNLEYKTVEAREKKLQAWQIILWWWSSSGMDENKKIKEHHIACLTIVPL